MKSCRVSPADRVPGASLLAPILPMLVCTVLNGCVSLSTPEALRTDLRRGRVDPHHVVFICQGMAKDFGSAWNDKLQAELQQDGALGLVPSYFTGFTGVWFNYGSIAPGNLVAHVADEITRIHDASGSSRELIIDAVGFSHGCEVLLRAACRFEEARFRRVVFINSSSLSFSLEASRLLREDKIQELRNYWSPLDIVTLFAPLGAGQFSLREAAEGIDNDMTCMPHIAFLITSRFRADLRSYFLEDWKPRREMSKLGRDVADFLDER